MRCCTGDGGGPSGVALQGDHAAAGGEEPALEGVGGGGGVVGAEPSAETGARAGEHGEDRRRVHGDRCVAEGDTLVGPVCVTVNNVLSNIGTSEN
jgi:hypothetical protein